MIYLIDTADRERFQEAKIELDKLLAIDGRDQSTLGLSRGEAPDSPPLFAYEERAVARIDDAALSLAVKLHAANRPTDHAVGPQLDGDFLDQPMF